MKLISLKTKLQNIEKDILNGLKLKSSDLLRNLINENPNDQDLRNRLAELYYQSGFLDAAGRYWILTEPINERITKSVEVYEKSVNYSGNKILQDLKFRGDKNLLSEYAQIKISKLEADSKKKTNYIPEFSPELNKSKRRNPNYQEAFKEKLGRFIFFGILISLGIFIVIGIMTVINLGNLKKPTPTFHIA